MNDEESSRCEQVRALAVDLLVASDQKDMLRLIDVAEELSLLFEAMLLEARAKRRLAGGE